MRDTVYVGSNDGRLYALDTSSGDEIWEFDTGQSIRSSPTVSDGIVYFGSKDGKTGGTRDNSLYAVDASTGEVLWSQPSNGWIASSPTVADGTVYVGSAPGSTGKNVYALDASSGNEKWVFSEPGWSVASSPTVAGDTVYFGRREDVPFSSEDGSVYAVSTDTGEKRWEFTEPSSQVSSSPTVVDGTVYVGSRDGNMYAIDAGGSGSSEGSRVGLGTFGHHSGFVGNQGVIRPTYGNDELYQTGRVTEVVGTVKAGGNISVTGEIKGKNSEASDDIVYSSVGLSDGTVLDVTQMDGLGSGTATHTLNIPETANGELVWSFHSATTEEAIEEFENNAQDGFVDDRGRNLSVVVGTVNGSAPGGGGEGLLGFTAVAALVALASAAAVLLRRRK